MYSVVREKFFPGIKFHKYLPYGKIILGIISKYLDEGSTNNKNLISDEWISVFKSQYACSNKKLAKRFDLDLSKYNYPI